MIITVELTTLQVEVETTPIGLTANIIQEIIETNIETITIEAEILGYANAGQSAYEIWLGEGNSGSKQDFLDSLLVMSEVDNETIELNNNKLSIKNKSTAEDNGIYMKQNNEYVFKKTIDGGLF